MSDNLRTRKERLKAEKIQARRSLGLSIARYAAFGVIKKLLNILLSLFKDD